MRTRSTRLLSMLLAVLMIFSLLPFGAFAANDTVTVIACSDFQNQSCTTNDHSAGVAAVQSILDEIIAGGHTSADGFICCGDYYKSGENNTTNSINGLTALDGCVTENFGADVDTIYAQGNHDGKISGLASTGANDTDNYGVYVLNEDDYEAYGASNATSTQLAADLTAYFNDKIASGYDKPVFVVSHVPLHGGPRAAHDGSGLYSEPIFAAVNDAGEDLNIIFLYGHNHSKDHDAYLGGSSIFLTKGDTMLVGNGDSEEFPTQTLNFTYMNAGYVGYYDDYSDADSTLTMSVFEINGNDVTISRYDADGVHVLKAVGDHTDYDYDSAAANNFRNNYEANTKSYSSPYTVSMADKQTFTDEGVTVVAYTGTELTVTTPVTVEAADADDSIDSYVAYAIELSDHTAGELMDVKLPVPDGYDPLMCSVYRVDANGNLSAVSASVSDSGASFTTTELGTYVVAQMGETDLNWVEIPSGAGEETTTISDGDQVVIRSVRKGMYLTNQDNGSNMLRLVNGTEDASVWTVTANDDGTYYLMDENGKYLTFDEQTGSVTTTPTKLNLNLLSEYSDWEISREVATSEIIEEYTPETVTADNYQANYPEYIGVTNYFGGDYYFKDGDKYRLVTGLTRKVKNDGKFEKWIVHIQKEPNKDEVVNKDVKQETFDIYKRTTEPVMAQMYLNNLDEKERAGGWTGSGANDPGSRWAFHPVILGDGCWAALAGRDFEFATSQFSSQAEVEAYIRDYIKVYTATDDQGTDKTLTDEYTFTGTLVPDRIGSGTLTVKYDGKVIGEIYVAFADKAAVNITVDKPGTVYMGSKAGTATGSTLTVTYNDGTTAQLPVTLSMVDGNYNIKKVGTYPHQTIKYGGQIIDYTLNVVVNPELDPFPKSPDEGSVTINKTAKAIDFKNTGVAQIELSAKGIPFQRGIDVIVMLDTSSSMVRTPSGFSETRSAIFSEAFKNLLGDLQTADSDIKIAVADFNGFENYTSGTPQSPYAADWTNDLMANNSTYSATNHGTVYTGTNAGQRGSSATLNADAFVDAEDIDITGLYNTFNTNSANVAGTPYYSGTNYDYALWATYQMGAAIQEYNKANDLDRDLVVVFMSDGCPYQYNGFSSGASDYWSCWLDGVEDSASTGSKDPADYLYAIGTHTTHDYFFGGVGNYAQKHRWNEAIKGSPAEYFDVIDKTVNTAAGDGQYMTSVPGLGATFYSIGFALDDDGDVEKEHAEHIIKELATSDDYWFLADKPESLDEAFARVRGDIFEAATNAYFDDEMGSEYDLQMGTFGPNDGSATYYSNIEVVTYEVWSRSDYLAGKCTSDQVGARKSAAPTVIETISFNDGGTAAWSDQLGGQSNNIFKDGLIIAKNFVYNTTGSSKTVSFNGKDITVGPESFYWNIGTIRETEYALRYYVYLTGTMEGQRDAGSYLTNDHATLHYVNYAGAEVSQSAPKPILAWQAAVVYYAAYLVNEQGQPINARGEVVSFADRVIVTNPSEGDKVLLNSDKDVCATVAAEVIPDDFRLYDEDAVYTVTVNSGTQVGQWDITSGTGISPQTTYVTGYAGPNDFSNATQDKDATHSYTATTVWFAVKYTIGAINDVIVIDYGIPVDISVLSNDMFYEVGTLEAVGETHSAEKPEIALASGFAKTRETELYTAAVHGNYVRFQVKDMNMAKAETFSYAVKYESPDQTIVDDDGYYYGKVTVIPATKVYYEDAFVSFSDSTAASGDMGVWTTDGIENTAATQAEDRPGFLSPTTIDANNVYGYDGANADCSTFSLGSAMKVTVDETSGSYNNAPRANFTFTGTGFDVISITDNRSGMIFVNITNHENGAAVDSLVVDNYYGYTYDSEGDGIGNHWFVTGSDDENALYQIPVIKYEGLDYGTYDVEIIAGYMSFYDVGHKGSYSIWIDAIRVYDPAHGDKTSEDAYELDKESTPDYAEIRNLIIKAENFYFGKAEDDSSVGVVYIDGIPLNAALGDFEETGPNNETYLDNTQAIAFQLVANEIPDSVQIGAKLINGESATLSFNGKEFKTLKTATDMYYEMSGINWRDNGDGTFTSDIIILQNTSTDGGVISLTNLKVTGGARFLNDISDSDDPTIVVKQADGPVLTAMVSPKMASRALMLANEYNTPAVYVYPEILSVTFDDDDIRTGETVTATIVANADTDYITVNGERIDAFTVNEDGNNVWTYSFTAEEAGEIQLEVVAGNNNGTESLNAIYTVNVAEPDPVPEKTNVIEVIVNVIKTVINKLFGWLMK